MNHDITTYAQKWNVIIENEITSPSGTVCLGTQGNSPIVLKLRHPDSDEAQQKDILNYYDGNAAARVIQSDGAAILLERLSPGHHLIELTHAGRDEEATRIFCRTARQLHAAEGSLAGFTSIEQLAPAFDRYLDSGDTSIAHSDVLHAKALYLALMASQAKPVLVHGDLHHDNILSDDVHGWVAIDPKGYVAEPTYEAGAWMRNPMKHMHQLASCESIEKRIAIMIEEMGWKRERIVKWSYAQAILSAIWSIEDGEKPDAALMIAKVLKSIDAVFIV
jgi:streptomycin 6-kinase